MSAASTAERNRPRNRARKNARPAHQAGLGIRLIVLSSAALSAACSEPPPLCQERTRRCLGIESRDIEVRGTERFEIRLANTCHEDIDYKLCFEVPGEPADCRQGTLAAARRAEENIALGRFGGRTRIFVRYASEAKACRFPLTRAVRF